MYSVQELKEIIEDGLKKIKLPKSPKNLYQPIEYTLELSAKRIRPLLLLMSFQLFNKDIKLAIPSALGIELFHNFTLLHDDIMDNSDLRRGCSTVHKNWDINTAILSGDAMLIYTYKYLLDTIKSDEVLKVFNENAIRVCEGQQLDMDFEEEKNVSIQDYLKMIEYKTAVLLATSLKIGAIIGGASDQHADNLFSFGKNIGIAFQLQDDLLDLYGNANSFGKKIGNDIIANKKTFMYLKALDIATTKQRDILRNTFSNNDINPDKKINIVSNIFNELDIKLHTKRLVQDYYENSLSYLNRLDNIETSEIRNFITNLLERNK